MSSRSSLDLLYHFLTTLLRSGGNPCAGPILTGFLLFCFLVKYTAVHVNHNAVQGDN